MDLDQKYLKSLLESLPPDKLTVIEEMLADIKSVNNQINAITKELKDSFLDLSYLMQKERNSIQKGIP